MKKFALIICAFCLISSFQNNANATLITFDDLPATTYPIYWGNIEDGYASLNWYNFDYLDITQQNLGVTGYQNGVITDPMVAFNQFGNPAAIYSDNSFTFNSVYLTSAWEEDLNVIVRGYNNGNEKYYRNVVLSTSNPQKVIFDFQDINYLSFDSFGGITVLPMDQNHFVMDNLTINEPITPVPEPSSVFLYIIGLIASLCLKKRM